MQKRTIYTIAQEPTPLVKTEIKVTAPYGDSKTIEEKPSINCEPLAAIVTGLDPQFPVKSLKNQNFLVVLEVLAGKFNVKLPPLELIK